LVRVGVGFGVSFLGCKYIYFSFLQDFVNFKSFARKKKPKELLKEWSKAKDAKNWSLRIIALRI
jgi:hypothetical protein